MVTRSPTGHFGDAVDIIDLCRVLAGWEGGEQENDLE